MEQTNNNKVIVSYPLFYIYPYVNYGIRKKKKKIGAVSESRPVDETSASSSGGMQRTRRADIRHASSQEHWGSMN